MSQSLAMALRASLEDGEQADLLPEGENGQQKSQSTGGSDGLDEGRRSADAIIIDTAPGERINIGEPTAVDPQALISAAVQGHEAADQVEDLADEAEAVLDATGGSDGLVIPPPADAGAPEVQEGGDTAADPLLDGTAAAVDTDADGNGTGDETEAAAAAAQAEADAGTSELGDASTEIDPDAAEGSEDELTEEEELEIAAESISLRMMGILQGFDMQGRLPSMESNIPARQRLMGLVVHGRAAAKALRKQVRKSLRSSLEDIVDVDDDSINNELEEIADKANDGSFQEWATELNTAATTVAELNGLAEKSEALAEAAPDAPVQPNQVTVEAMAQTLNALSGRYGIRVQMESLESLDGYAGSHANIARMARRYASHLEDGMQVSVEAMPFKYVFNALRGLEGLNVEFDKAAAELRKNADLYKEGAVAINHLGIFKFLTVNDKQVTDIPAAIADNNKKILGFFDLGEELHKDAEGYIKAILDADMTTQEGRDAIKQKLRGSANVSNKLKKLQGQALLGNHTVVVTDDTATDDNGAEHDSYLSAYFDKQKVSPTNKAAWWARIPAGVLGAAAGAKTLSELVGGGVSPLVFGALGGGLVGTVAATGVWAYGVYRGGKFIGGQSMKNVDIIASGLKTKSETKVSDMAKMLDEMKTLGRKALEYRRLVKGSYDRYLEVDSLIEGKMKAADMPKAELKDMRKAVQVAMGALQTEFVVYELGVDAATFTLRGTLNLVEKLNAAAEKIKGGKVAEAPASA